MQCCLKRISFAPADLKKSWAGPQGCSTDLITAASGELLHQCIITPSFKDHGRMHSENTDDKYCWYPAQYPQVPVVLPIFPLSPVLGNTAKRP